MSTRPQYSEWSHLGTAEAQEANDPDDGYFDERRGEWVTWSELDGVVKAEKAAERDRLHRRAEEQKLDQAALWDLCLEFEGGNEKAARDLRDGWPWEREPGMCIWDGWEPRRGKTRLCPRCTSYRAAVGRCPPAHILGGEGSRRTGRVRCVLPGCSRWADAKDMCKPCREAWYRFRRNRAGATLAEFSRSRSKMLERRAEAGQP